MNPSAAHVAAQFLAPAEQWKRDLRNKARHQRESRREFDALVTGLASVVKKLKRSIPGKSKDAKVLRARKKALLAKIEASQEFTKFLDRRIGKAQNNANAVKLRKSVQALARDAALGTKELGKILEALDTKTGNSWQAKALSRAQAPVRKVLPEQLRAFLPPNIIVDVDDSGNIQRVTDRFQQQHKTMAVKIRKMKHIILQYNEIVKKVKKDLKSADEIIRMSALITAILMETGIRPGRSGNLTTIKVDGVEVPIETFGAITLGPAHVRFVRKNFASLEFTGKAGTVNTASLSDKNIIRALDDFVKKARSSGSKYIFTTSGGRRFTKGLLEGYFSRNFKGISPTDFRKLRATEAVLQGLRERQEALYAEIRSFVDLEKKLLKERVIEAVERTVSAAVTDARHALSHESGKDVTQRSYINPQVLLRFFETGQAAADLKEAIMVGEPRLAFDPMTFVQMAKPQSLAASSVRKGTLKSLLAELEEELAHPIVS